MGKKGRPTKYDDPLHKYMREYMNKYYKKNREPALLACRLGIKIPQAREILKNHPDLMELFRPNPAKKHAEEKLERIRKELKESE